jgi:hypothetical protein
MLEVGHDVSFDNMGLEENTEINGKKAYVTNDDSCRRILNGCYITGM